MSNSPDINLSDFVQHFKQLSDIWNESNFRSDAQVINSENISIDELDCPFTTVEISNTLNSMSKYKSADYENNVADFFINSQEFISPYLADIFNYIYDNGSYPDSWHTGVIIHVHKKGDKQNPNNYRGITLVNVTSKIFSLLLRNIINGWCERNNVFKENQFGFRDYK